LRFFLKPHYFRSFSQIIFKKSKLNFNILLFLSFLLFVGQSCSKQSVRNNEIDTAKIDQFLVNIGEIQQQVISSITVPKGKSNKILGRIETAIENEDRSTINEIYNSYGVTDDALGTIEGQILDLLAEFDGDQQELETVVEERMRTLIDEGLIDVEALLGAKDPDCDVGGAVEVVVEGALGTIGGCSAGPIGCVVGLGWSLWNIIDFAIECAPPSSN